MTTRPFHTLKPGDRVNGREVFDVRATLRGRFEAVGITGDAILDVPDWETPVETDDGEVLR